MSPSHIVPEMQTLIWKTLANKRCTFKRNFIHLLKTFLEVLTHYSLELGKILTLKKPMYTYRDIPLGIWNFCNILLKDMKAQVGHH